jgi:hypothetical protein
MVRTQPPARLYTLRQISEKTGVDLRLLQFWTVSRLLEPEGEHPGRGSARWFSDIEMQIVSMLSPLAYAGELPIGKLKVFAFILRGVLDGSFRPGQRRAGVAILNSREIRRVLHRAARGEGRNYFVACLASSGETAFGVVTDEEGPPRLDLETLCPEGFPHDRALTIVIDLTARLASLNS